MPVFIPELIVTVILCNELHRITSSCTVVLRVSAFECTLPGMRLRRSSIVIQARDCQHTGGDKGRNLGIAGRRVESASIELMLDEGCLEGKRHRLRFPIHGEIGMYPI